MSAQGWLAFLCACALGAPSRYLLDVWIRNKTAGSYPWGTWVVNVTGCFLLGVLTGWALQDGLGQTTVTIAGAGFLGCYTTFSTFTLQSVLLAERSELPTAVGYIASSVAAGCVAAGAGLALGG